MHIHLVIAYGRIHIDDQIIGAKIKESPVLQPISIRSRSSLITSRSKGFPFRSKVLRARLSLLLRAVLVLVPFQRLSILFPSASESDRESDIPDDITRADLRRINSRKMFVLHFGVGDYRIMKPPLILQVILQYVRVLLDQRWATPGPAAPLPCSSANT